MQLNAFCRKLLNIKDLRGPGAP